MTNVIIPIICFVILIFSNDAVPTPLKSLMMTATKQSQQQQNDPIANMVYGPIESLKPSSSPSSKDPKYKPLSMMIGTRGVPAYIFHNGQFVGVIKPKDASVNMKKFKIKVRQSDVISIICKGDARENINGIMAVIDYNKGQQQYITEKQSSNTFQSLPLHFLDGHARKTWRQSSYQSCHWNQSSIVNVGHGNTAKKAANDIFPKHARLVWNQQAYTDEVVLFRIRLDDHEKCPHHNNHHVPSKCNCEQISSSSGHCYQFTQFASYSTYNREASCRSRQCVPKYACTHSKTKHTSVCYLTFAQSEVRPISSFSNRKCINVKLSSPKPFYVPYQSA